MNNLFKDAFIYLRRMAYLSLWAMDVRLERRSLLNIFCYHSISEDGWRFAVPVSRFKLQIEYLLGRYTPITLDHLNSYFQGKKSIGEPSFVLTFDDGYSDILRVKDYLRSRNIKPAVFLLSDKKRINRKELATNRQLLRNHEIRMLINEGWTIGCHGATHQNLVLADKKNIYEEVAESKKTLEKELNTPIRYFAYPKGKYNEEVLKEAKKAGYELCLTMDDGCLDMQTDRFRIPRVGVDRTHGNQEFKAIFSPSNIAFRKLAKRSFNGFL